MSKTVKTAAKLTHKKIDGDGCEFCNQPYNNPAHYGNYTCPYCKTLWQGMAIDANDANDAITALLDVLDGEKEHDLQAATGLPAERCAEIYAVYCRLLVKYQGKLR